MNPALRQLSTLSLFALAAASRGFGASDDFSDYSTPARFSSRAVTDPAGAGDPGTGAKGNGWLNGWRSATTNAVPALSVINADPLAFGGNYLNATLSANPAAPGMLDATAIGRAYDFAGASLSGPVTIRFEFRADAIATDTLRLDLFESGGRASSSTANGSSYCFRTVGDQWHYFDGIDLLPTGVALRPGVAYSFEITIHPATFTYSFTLSGGDKIATISGAAFRARNFTPDTAEGSAGGRWVQFAAIETIDVAGQSATISIDGLSVSARPAGPGR